MKSVFVAVQTVYFMLFVVIHKKTDYVVYIIKKVAIVYCLISFSPRIYANN